MTAILPSVRHAVTVEAARARAFDVFTRAWLRWWPRDHHIGKAPLAEIVLEPKVGGRWYERGEDGGECDWGRVRIWEPPARVVLAWHIDAKWQFDPDPERASEVEVRFIEEGAARTRVELEHRHIERHGPGAEAIAASVAKDGGWREILARFRDMTSGSASTGASV
jgi:hypothetical protein